jgi:hypothetical protein
VVPAGRIERVKATNAKRALTKKHGAQREKFASSIEDTMLKATITPFNGSYKESEHQKAMAMLVDASEKWNFRQGALTAFEGEHMLTHREILEFTNCITMTPTMFKEQLRRNFHIKLSAGQLAALIKHFDSGNADGTISCHKFQNEFIRMGNFSCILAQILVVLTPRSTRRQSRKAKAPESQAGPGQGHFSKAAGFEPENQFPARAHAPGSYHIQFYICRFGSSHVQNLHEIGLL